MAIPTITVAAKPLTVFRAGSVLTLGATAKLASCFEGSQLLIDFSWRNTMATRKNGSAAPLLLLDSVSRSQPALRISGATLESAVTYTIAVQGCMREQPLVCGQATRDVELEDEPLRAEIAGGSRDVGEDDSLVLNACASADPDEPGTALSFVWTCNRVLAENRSADFKDLAAPCNLPAASGDCLWSLPAGSLQSIFFYTFAVDVSKDDGETASASVGVNVKAGALPAVSISSLAQPKQNPTDRIRLSGQASLPNADAASANVSNSFAFTWSIDDDEIDLSSPAVTTTGNMRSNLVVKAGRLQPGASYYFTLCAAYRGRVSCSTINVIINAKPYGGTCTLTCDAPAVALSTKITLSAPQWQDEDQPLFYAYSYVDASLLDDANTTLVDLETASTPLASRSMDKTYTWETPQRGDWHVLCIVYDAYGAKTILTTPLTVEVSVRLEPESFKHACQHLVSCNMFCPIMQRRRCRPEMMYCNNPTSSAKFSRPLEQKATMTSWPTSLFQWCAFSILSQRYLFWWQASELNIKAEERRRRRRLSDTDGVANGPCGVAEEEAKQSGELRSSMIGYISSSQGAQSVNPESIKASISAVGSIVSEPCEISAGSQDQTLAVFDSLLGKSSEAGLESGSSSALINGLSSLFEANDYEAQKGEQVLGDADEPASSEDEAGSGEADLSSGELYTGSGSEHGSGTEISSGDEASTGSGLNIGSGSVVDELSSGAASGSSDDALSPSASTQLLRRRMQSAGGGADKFVAPGSPQLPPTLPNFLPPIFQPQPPAALSLPPVSPTPAESPFELPQPSAVSPPPMSPAPPLRPKTAREAALEEVNGRTEKLRAATENALRLIIRDTSPGEAAQTFGDRKLTIALQ
eukprot:6173286-Pleurochrysis_carterae.AAC.1